MRHFLTLFLLLSVLACLSVSATGQDQKKITEADIKKCVKQKEKEAADRGYPIMDPFAARSQCMKELKGE